MRYFFVLGLCSICALTSSLSAAPKRANSPAHFLNGRIEKSDKRYSTLLQALQLMQQRKSLTIVETGTARLGNTFFAGDGGFTLIVGDYVRERGGKLYSVDIDSQALATAASALGLSRNFVQLVNQDSVAFLHHFKEPIDFLYLDSFDYDASNPLLSQQHHLNEILAAYPNLSENSVVMIDDCDLPEGGKGKLAINFLLSQGWKIIANSYQVILIPGKQAFHEQV